MKTKPVPWNYVNDELRSWTWTTEHFEIIIRSADNEIFYYQITDFSTPTASGMGRPIYDGKGATFKEVEDEVLEFIGKAYPARLHYRIYAGARATTFPIYTGEKVNFGPLEGRTAKLKVRNKHGSLLTLSGVVQIVNFDIIITTSSGEKKKIPSQWIVDGETDKAESILKLKYSTSRTVSGERVRGCTGTLGFNPNTVDHGPAAGYCPIHNI